MKNKYVLIVLGVAGLSISGPMVRWSLSCGASPVMISFLRVLISTLVLLGPAMRSGEMQQMLRAPKRLLLIACVSAFFLAMNYFCWITSMDCASTFVSTALVCTQPLFVMALSGVLLKEPIPRRAIPGALVSIAGAVMIGCASISGGSGSLKGNVLALMGAAFGAGQWLTSRFARRQLPALGYMTFIYCITALYLLLLIPFAGGWVVTLPSMGGIVAMSLLCTLGGHALLTYLLGFVGADIVSFALLAEPIGAAVWAFLLFGETVSPSVLLGGLVIIAGLVLYTWKSRR